MASNSCGSSSCNAQLTVNTKPALTCEPSNVNVCTSNASGSGNGVCLGNNSSNNSACFTICANGSNLKYQWFENGKAVSACNTYSGCTSSSFCVLNYSGKNGYTYYVIVSNSCGSVTSSSALLIVDTPPSITTQPQGVCVNSGGNATFCVTASDHLIISGRNAAATFMALPIHVILLMVFHQD